MRDETGDIHSHTLPPLAPPHTVLVHGCVLMDVVRATSHSAGHSGMPGRVGKHRVYGTYGTPYVLGMRTA